MKFTKEQIEYLRKDFTEMSGKSMKEWFDSLLKPEREKIIIEIEQDKIGGVIEAMNESMILQALVNGFDSRRNISVRKLSEVFTREDVIEFANYDSDFPEFLTVNNFDNWLSERKSK